MIGEIVNKIRDEASFLLSFIKNYKEVENLAKLSVLADENSRNYSTEICPICMYSEMEVRTILCFILIMKKMILIF